MHFGVSFSTLFSHKKRVPLCGHAPSRGPLRIIRFSCVATSYKASPVPACVRPFETHAAFCRHVKLDAGRTGFVTHKKIMTCRLFGWHEPCFATGRSEPPLVP